MDLHGEMANRRRESKRAEHAMRLRTVRRRAHSQVKALELRGVREEVVRRVDQVAVGLAPRVHAD